MPKRLYFWLITAMCSAVALWLGMILLRHTQ